MIGRSSTAAVAAVAVALGSVAGASAHVTLQPESAPAGAFERLDVRVPNERDDASTTKVEVKFPPGFIFVSYEPVPGWETEVRMGELDEPVEAFGEPHTEQVDTVTFRATGEGVRPGQFQDFGLSVGLPDDPGAVLTFKALQTYSNGEVVRWIGAPDADDPAPTVTLTAPAGPDAAAHGSGDAQASGASAAPADSGGGDGTDGGDTLAIVALIVGAAGLLAGLGGLVAARRARTRAVA
ncbi:MAG TPA: YcnI family protein [Capillimicrobium sp.]|nr:YcnI family protein [Capillimicrobium sp.]